jgi:DUF1365 family protein
VNSCIYAGHLMHRRSAPVVHTFCYPVSTFYFDLDELEGLDRALRLFSVNRANVVSFRDGDHMDGQPTKTKEKILAFLRSHGIDLEGGKVFLLTQCRVFNYVFNPASFYYCHAAGGALRCVVAEVNNTFGARHLYLLSEHNRLPVAAHAARVDYEARKVMHVSPFVSMDARYGFRFAPVAERLSVSMTESEHGQHFFDAHLYGRRVALTDRRLAWLLLRYPFVTLKIIAAIHWEALRLYLKGVPFYHQPAPSAEQRDQLRLMNQLGREVVQ